MPNKKIQVPIRKAKVEDFYRIHEETGEKVAKYGMVYFVEYHDGFMSFEITVGMDKDKFRRGLSAGEIYVVWQGGYLEG